MPRDTHKETFVLPILYHANLAIKCKRVSQMDIKIGDSNFDGKTASVTHCV